MKKRYFALLLLFILLHTHTTAQVLKQDTATQKYTVREVIPCDTALTQQQIYEACRQWAMRTFKSSDNNVMLDDKTYSEIITSGAVKTSDMPIALCAISNCTVDFKLIIQVKPGKIRCTIDNIVHYGTNTCSNPPSRMTTPLEQWNQKTKLTKSVFADIETKLAALVKDLKATVTQPAKPKDDW